jgi:hypothetical protein
MENKLRLYLDDVRTPKADDWVIARNYDEFISTILLKGLENFETISLDHDLGDTAMKEYFNNVSPNYTLDYNNIKEKTGLDCAKWLVHHYFDKYDKKESRNEKKQNGITFPTVYVHSANPIGSANIMGYINNFFKNERRPQTCVRVKIEHTMETKID